MMAAAKQISEPAGIGKGGAAEGTRDWADRLRLNSLPIVDRAADSPIDFQRYHDKIATTRAWSLMNKPDGSFFRSLEEFSAHPKPYGWGRKYEEELRPLLAIAAAKSKVKTAVGALPAEGDVALALAEVPAGAQGRRTDREEETSRHDGGKLTDSRTDERLRAVLRAPAPVQDLFRAGLVSQGVAAALGPAKQTPEEAARIREASNAAEEALRAEGAPKTPAEKRKTKAAVDAAVRRVIGPPPDRTPAFAGEVVTAEAKRLTTVLTRPELADLISRLQAFLNRKVG